MGAVGIIFKYELLEAISNRPHAHFIFSLDLDGGLLQILAIDSWSNALYVLLDPLDTL